MSADPRTIPVEDLRGAAQALTTRDGARRIRILPVPQRMMAALLEAAFPSHPRGLAYSEELEDLHRYLARCSPIDEVVESLVDAAVAVHDSYTSFDDSDPEDLAVLDLLRSVAAYVVRIRAVELAKADHDNRGQAP